MKNTSRSFIVIVSLIVALGGFLMGFDASVISGVVKFIEVEFNLSKLELGWAVSSLTLTATIAMMLVGPLSDRIGRKKVLIIAAAVYTLSAVLSAVATNFVFLVIARMIGGFGVGASLIIAPMYIAEIAPAHLRGRLVSFNQLNIVIGISTAFFTNYLILLLGNSYATWAQWFRFDEYNWRWMLGLEAVPATLYFMAMFFVPRSPRWLIMKGYEAEALDVLKRAVGTEQANNDFNSVKESISADQDKKTVSRKELFKPALKTVLVIGIVLAILQQITGINSVFFYAPMIFEQSGIGTDAAFSQAIYVGLINLVFTLVAIAVIDRFGRKPLLVFGLSGITISMLLLSYSFGNSYYMFDSSHQEMVEIVSINPEISKLNDQTFNSEELFLTSVSDYIGSENTELHKQQIINSSIHLNSSLILIAILGFVASFAVSLGPVMWVLFSELFPNYIRAVAISFVGFINSIISFLVQLVFPAELEYLGSSATFLIYGLFAAAGLMFVWMKVPETKGKSLEELEKYLIK